MIESTDTGDGPKRRRDGADAVVERSFRAELGGCESARERAADDDEAADVGKLGIFFRVPACGVASYGGRWLPVLDGDGSEGASSGGGRPLLLAGKGAATTLEAAA